MRGADKEKVRNSNYNHQANNQSSFEDENEYKTTY
jgi:hypothetical protein